MSQKTVAFLIFFLLFVQLIPQTDAYEDMERGKEYWIGVSGVQIDYVILSPANFVDNIIPLAKWKTKKGWNTAIYTIPYIYSRYDCSTNFAKVHAFLRDLYKKNPNMKWLLIVGDGDMDSETFPVPYIRTNASQDPVMGGWSVADVIASDVMYSGLDSDWDENGNEYFGEKNEGDWEPDLYVGRWPVKLSSEVSKCVDKVLTYEKNPPVGDWMKSALMIGALYDIPNNVATDPTGWTDGYYEWPHDNGRTPIINVSKHFPQTMYKKYLFDYDRVEGGHYDSSNDMLNQTTFKNEFVKGYAIVTTASHGWVSGQGLTNYVGNGSEAPGTPAYVNFKEYFFYTDAASFTNGYKLPLIYSSACDAANFTTIYHFTVGENRDKTLEQLLKNPNGGAIGFISATNADYWNDYDGNWWLLVDFWRTFFNGHYRPGEALYESKKNYEKFLKSIGRNTDIARYRQNKATYVLLGDPEVPIWTDIPSRLSVQYPDKIYTVKEEVRVIVKDNSTNEPVKNAMVAFVNDNTFARGFTDNNGICKIYVSAKFTGKINITVSAHNYYPYETEIPVEPSPPDLFISEDKIIIEPSGVAEAGKNVTIKFTVENRGGQDALGVSVGAYLKETDEKICTVNIGTIEKMSEVQSEFVWNALHGEHEIIIIADPDNVLKEYNEDNNEASVVITSSGIDLIISTDDVKIEPSVNIDGMLNMPNNTKVEINITVKNIGSYDAESVYVRVYDGDPKNNGTMIGFDARILSVPSGGKGNTSISWEFPPQGNHQLFIRVDPRNFITEFNESNNNFTISVFSNAPPSFGKIPNLTIDEDAKILGTLSLDQYVYDPDTPLNKMTYGVEHVSTDKINVSVDRLGYVTITLEENWYGSGKVTFMVSDGVSKDYSHMNITVRQVNDPPRIEAIGNFTIYEGEEFIYQVNATDPDGDILKFYDDTELFEIDEDTGRIVFKPGIGQSGTYRIKIWVEDDEGLSDEAVLRLKILRKNRPPHIEMTEKTFYLTEGKEFILKINATDPDGDRIIFADNTPLFDIDPKSGIIVFTPESKDVGTYNIKITVSDEKGLNTSVDITFIIQEKEKNIVQHQDMTSIYILLGIIIIACIAGIGIAYAISAKSKKAEIDRRKEEEYRKLYGEDKKEVKRDKCPTCGSYDIYRYEDEEGGGAICRNCGRIIE